MNLTIPVVISSKFKIELFTSCMKGQKSQIVGNAMDDGKSSVPFFGVFLCDLENTEFNGFLFNNVKQFNFADSNISGNNHFKLYRNILEDTKIHIRFLNFQFFFDF